jgi:glycosyltransferase 2 family protein
MHMILGNKKLWIGIVISLFFLLLLFAKINIGQIVDAFRGIDYRYLLGAIFAVFASYYTKAIRWQYLLRKFKKCSIANVFSITIIGLMVNGLLFAPAGQIAQAYIMAEREGVSKGAGLASLVLDRLCDGFALLILLIGTFLTLDMRYVPENAHKVLEVGGYITLSVCFLGILFLILLKIRTASILKIVTYIMKPFSLKIAEKSVQALDSFIHGIRMPSKSAHSVAIAVSSLVMWIFLIIAVDLVLCSFGLFLPITVSMFTSVLLSFAVMIPASPGYLGTYEYAGFIGLTAFNVQEGKAVSAALIIHAVNFLPVIIAGFFYLWKGNISWRNLTRHTS